MPERITYQEGDRYCEYQINAFLYAINKLILKDSFLSLTGGLDTRTILSALIQEGKEIPTSYTMSGYPLTLDARIANDLCKYYGIEHNTIVLGDSFFNNLEKYLIDASRLSGGICSLDQATEVYFYNQIDSKFIGRISGNMGNQIGRGGTEGVSMRNANIEVLNPELLSSMKGYDLTSHWFHKMDTTSSGLEYISLLQNEIPNSSVGNYSIGNYFAVQKTPYANRKLIEVSLHIPKKDKHQAASLIAMRMKDLYHRFLGESEKISFQRKYINRCGGFVAEYPINWGWKASGGISILKFFQGCLSIIDAFAEKRMIENEIGKQMLGIMRISGLHVYKHPSRWLKEYLRNFVYDSVMSTANDEIFNKNIMINVLDDYFNKNINKYHSTILFILDLCMAKQLFY